MLSELVEVEALKYKKLLTYTLSCRNSLSLPHSYSEINEE